MGADADTPKPRSRYSLRALLVVTAFVAMAIVIWRLYAELAPLRTEVRRLRDEVGELTIEDETKVHAIAVRTDDDLTWKWRVWIPEGRKYTLRYSGEQIPQQGFAPSGNFVGVEPGGGWVEYRIRRDPETGRWMDELVTKWGSVGSLQQDWVAWGNMTATNGGVVSHSTRAFNGGKPVVLMRHRVSQASDSSQIEKQTAGFMVWLEPVP